MSRSKKAGRGRAKKEKQQMQPSKSRGKKRQKPLKVKKNTDTSVKKSKYSKDNLKSSPFIFKNLVYKLGKGLRNRKTLDSLAARGVESVIISKVSENSVSEEWEKEPDSSQSNTKTSEKSNNSLFTEAEKEDLKKLNTNLFNPNSEEYKQKHQMNKKRLVLIDGSNVAFGHSRHKNFSVNGLKICMDCFTNLGHEVRAVLPLWRLEEQSTYKSTLENMYKEGKLLLTPSSCYDDRIILQLAAELDAAVVSNDNYCDLIIENVIMRKIITSRVIGFSWLDDIFIIPKDPYGRDGPTLSSILNRKTETSQSSQ